MHTLVVHKEEADCAHQEPEIHKNLKKLIIFQGFSDTADLTCVVKLFVMHKFLLICCICVRSK